MDAIDGIAIIRLRLSELDFTSNNSIFDSDSDYRLVRNCMSSHLTLKPSVFINTPPKINNENMTTINKTIRNHTENKIGIQVKPDNLANITDKIHVLNSAEKYADEITAIVDKYIANFGSSGVIGSRYIINRLKEVGKKR